MNKKTVWIIIALLLLLALYGFLSRKSNLSPGNDLSLTTATSTSNSGLDIGGDGDFIVEQVPIDEGIPAPDLARPIIFSAGVSEEFKRIMTERINKTSAKLKKNPENIDAWLDLAIHWKTIDDYKGAAEIWEYVLEFQPDNSVVLGNLGELYHLYLKDYPKSENYYKRAIALDQTRIALYRGLHELYKYSYKKETTAAADILKTGLERNPNNTDLLILLGAYFKDKGDKNSARFYYEQALAIAKQSGNQVLVEALERDLNRL